MADSHGDDYVPPIDRRAGEATGQFTANLLLVDLGRRVAKVEGGLGEQQKALTENTRLTAATAESVASLEQNLAGAVKFFKAMDGTITLAAMLGKLAKWLTIIGAALALIWLTIKFVILEAIKGMK